MAEKKVELIIEAISGLNVVELVELIKSLEEKFGIQMSQMPFAAGGVAAPGTQIAAPVEEKTEFSVVLVNAGSQKIPVIKVIREIMGLGLKEAKDFVESAPKTVKENIPKEQAEEMKKKLTEIGATVEVK